MNEGEHPEQSRFSPEVINAIKDLLRFAAQQQQEYAVRDF